MTDATVPAGGPAHSGDHVAALPAPPSLLADRRVRWAALALLALGWSLLQAGMLGGGDRLNTGGWPLVVRFLEAALHPELSPDFLRLTLEATVTTVTFAVCGTALSLVLGAVGGVLASETWWRLVLPPERARLPFARMHRSPWLVARAVIVVPRAIHEMIWGLFFVAILGLKPLVGILAIAIPFGAITAKVFSELLDEAPHEALAALTNAGVPPARAFVYGLVPTALPDLVSYAFYRFECSIRSAAVLGIIGAGGLGYQLLLSIQALRYEELWTLLTALVLLTGLTDLWSTALRRRLGSAHQAEFHGAAHPRRATGAQPGDRVIKASLLGAAALVVFSFWHVGPQFAQLFSSRTGTLLADLLARAVPPSLAAVGWGEMLRLSQLTLAMSVLAMSLAGLGGVLLAFPAAHTLLLPGGVLHGGGESHRARWRSLWGTTVYVTTRAVLLFLRGVPAPIWALLLLFIFFPGILPGAVALGLYTLGVLGRLMAEVVENLDRRPLDALRAQGASGWQVFLYGVLPETLPRFTAYLLYRWEVSIRATVMVGLVGAGGLGRLLTEQLSSFDYQGVAMTVLFYIGLTFLVDLVSVVVRRDLRNGAGRRA